MTHFLNGARVRMRYCSRFHRAPTDTKSTLLVCHLGYMVFLFMLSTATVPVSGFGYENRIAVSDSPFQNSSHVWGQTTQILIIISLSPKRDCSSKIVKRPEMGLGAHLRTWDTDILVYFGKLKNNSCETGVNGKAMFPLKV